MAFVKREKNVYFARLHAQKLKILFKYLHVVLLKTSISVSLNKKRSENDRNKMRMPMLLLLRQNLVTTIQEIGN